MAKDIVVIDDDPALLQFAAHVLQSEGHRVNTFDDGFAALSHLANTSPDIVIIDYVLPRIDGDELCRIVRSMSHLEHCFIVLISAAATEIDVEIRDLCIDSCIAKGPFPAMARHLVEVVARADRPQEPSGSIDMLGGETAAPRRLTRELFARKRHLEMTLDCIDEGVLEIDDGTVVFANSAAVHLLARPRERLLGRRLREAFADPEWRHVEAALADTDGLSSWAASEGPAHLNDRLVTIRRLPTDGAENTVLMLTDITEHKRLEEQLFRAQKLEAVGTMAGGIAHNFNNLLQGVLGSASLLLNRSEQSDHQHGLLKHIVHCGEQGAELTRQLLDFARGQASETTRVSTNVVVEDALKIFEASRRATIVDRDYDEQTGSICADVAAIEQVMLNLCLNASEAMGSGGVITVTTGNVELTDRDLAGHDIAPGHFVKITVADTGVGIDDELKTRVFEPFFTTKGPGAGTGLGLASSFGIVRNHGGVIDFESTSGCGTTFSVYLPASHDELDDEGLERPEVPSGSENLLVVDDEDHVLAVFGTMLTALGYSVHAVSSGRDALEAVLAGKAFDLVVLDVVMPEMSGWEVAQCLWDRAPATRILFASGYSPDSACKPDGLTGPHSFLQKPFDLVTLGCEVRRILDDD